MTVALPQSLPLAFASNAAPIGFRIARAIRTTLGVDRQRRWNRQYAAGGWEWLANLDELAHHAVLAAYFARLKPNGSLLDVGCGTGVFFDQLRGCHTRYLGIDFEEPVRISAAGRADARSEFQAADMNDFVTAERFDAIVFNESIYYLHDARAGLTRFETMLAPGGVFLISMHGKERNQVLWDLLETRYRVADAVTIRNQRDVSWTTKVLVPPFGGA